MTYTEKIIDISTGQETIRPYTSEEIAAIEALQAELAEKIAQENAEQDAKNAARQAVLDKLGLKADEVAALLG